MAKAQGAETVIISAAIESEVAQLPEEEAKEFLERARPSTKPVSTV